MTLPSSDKHHAPAALVMLGRAGLAARGIVYLTVGALAGLAGFGQGSAKPVDQRGALRVLGESPLGVTVLWIVAFGLASYVLWRFGQVLFARGENDTGAKRLGKRTVAFGSGLAYAGLSFTAFRQALGLSHARQTGFTQQQGAEWLMAQPLGQWLVAAVGAGVIVAAIAQFVRAVTARFIKHLRLDGLPAAQERWICRTGRAGFGARGISFALIGWFFLQAAVKRDAHQAGGMADALQTLSSQRSGPALLVIVGAGLALFGAYSLVEARYRRIE